MAPVSLQGSTSGGRIGVLGPLVIGVFDGSPDLGLLDHLERVHVESAARYGRFTSLSIVATPKVETPSAEYRKRSAELTARFQPQLIGTGIVILAIGAAAVVARTFLAASALLVRHTHPQGTFRQIAPAVSWLQELPGQVAELKGDAGLAAAVEAFTWPPKT